MNSTMTLDGMLQADRRKKADSLRRGSSSTEFPKIPTGPRGAITKNRFSRASSQPPSSLDGKWSHDLYTQNENKTVAATITLPRGGRLPSKLSPEAIKTLSSNRLFTALHGGNASTNNGNNGKNNNNNGGMNNVNMNNNGQGSGTSTPDRSAGLSLNDIGANIRGVSKPGFSIKGSAGPFAVHAMNFAPGTSENDIRAAMESIGNIIQCEILSSTPTVIAEIVFEKKEDADRCIRQYNNQKADGYILHLVLQGAPTVKIPEHYTQPRPTSALKPQPRANVPTRDFSEQVSGNYVDGTYGFVDPSESALYSDALVQRGRGRFHN